MRGDLFGREAERLEIGEAPIRLAQTGQLRDAFAVSRDSLVLAPRRLQRVAVAHPAFRLLRMAFQDLLIGCDGAIGFAQPREYGRFQIAIARILRMALQQFIGLRQCIGRFVLTMQDGRVVEPRRVKSRRQLDAARQQCFGLIVMAEPRARFRQHADRGHIGGMIVQKRPQDALAVRQIVVAQRACCLDQSRVVYRSAE